MLGVPQPVEGGLFNEYALIQISNKSLNVDIHGFHANGAPMGVMDNFSIHHQPSIEREDTDGDGLPDAWELANQLNPNDIASQHGASGDPDFDGLTNLQEYLAGTNPMNPDSSLRIVNVESKNSSISLTWSSQPNKLYRIESSTDMIHWAVLSVGSTTFKTVGLKGQTSIDLPVSRVETSVFYRIKLD